MGASSATDFGETRDGARVPQSPKIEASLHLGRPSLGATEWRSQALVSGRFLFL